VTAAEAKAMLEPIEVPGLAQQVSLGRQPSGPPPLGSRLLRRLQRAQTSVQRRVPVQMLMLLPRHPG
jgi:hypothetical protein